MKKKGVIYLDPVKDKALIPIFKAFIKKPVVIYDYKNKDAKLWQDISRKIGVRCKNLYNKNDFDAGFMFPPSTNRNNKIGYVTRPMDTELIIEQTEKEMKIMFRKIF